MHRASDDYFDTLRKEILGMGSKVEQAIELAMTGLLQRNSDYFKQVHELEKEINETHMKVDEDALHILAKQAPLASSLRFVFSVVKINADLERMGDQAVNIAYNGEHYISKPDLKPLTDIPKMATEVSKMVRESLSAFVDQNVILAEQVLVHDEIVDAFKQSVTEELVALMAKDATNIRQAMNLILIARNLERLADHATNIAEEAIFSASGKDIRHGHAV